MAMSMRYSLFLGVLLSVTSCMKEIDLEDLRPDPKLVLNGVASQGEPLKASLSRTWFYTEDYPNVSISDAKVNLYVNDRFFEEMTWDVEEYEYYTIGNYISSYIPVSGDKVRIEAERDGFKKIVAREAIPHKPALLNLTAEEIKNQEPYSSGKKKRIKVTFKDDPNAVNCYLINFSIGKPYYEYDYENPDNPPVYTGEYYWSQPSIDYASEPLFGNSISILDKVMGNDWLSARNGRPFSDELINGKEYTMKLEGDSYYWSTMDYDEPDSVRVYLYAISESYYKYLFALLSLYEGSLNSDLASAGLAEPVRVFSNIEGGVGIFGTACVDSLTVAVSKLH